MRRKDWKVATWKVHPQRSASKNHTRVARIATDLAVLALNQDNPVAYATIDRSGRQQLDGLTYVGSGRIENERFDGKPRFSRKISAVLRTQPGVGAAWFSKGEALICPGDSGGPLFTERGAVVGIASSVGVAKNVEDYCGAGDVVLHADVNSSLNWIACTFRGWGVPLPGFEKPNCN